MMYKTLKISLLLCFFTLICTHAGAQTSEYKRITATEARKMMMELNDFTLLDVRTESEYRRQHIEGAKLMPHTDIPRRAESELPDKNKIILVYCQAGVRSERAARALLDLGYTNVYDFGGIADWPYGVIRN